MADTTISFSNISSVNYKDHHGGGAFGIWATYTYGLTISASQFFYALPIPDKVTILQGYVFSTHNTSYSFQAMVGWPDAKSLFMADQTVGSSSIQWFNQGLPHVNTLTDSDS